MTRQTNPETAADVLRERAEQVKRALDEVLTCPDEPGRDPSAALGARLYEAMRYMVLGGGKKLRPALVLLSCEACGGSAEAAMPAACAVEMVHTYSLIHDDLPAMDDDDLRRGKPSCHKAFGEATAILAGDALLSEAFGVLATRIADPETARRLVAELAAAAGADGMVGGQAADLAAQRQESSDERLLEAIHQQKTAALIAASVVMGALCAGASEHLVRSLREYGTHLGLAFQIADDVLDAEGATEVLGKTAGKDAAAGKLTYVKCCGIAAARKRAHREADRAVDALGALGRKADRLARLARFAVERTY